MELLTGNQIGSLMACYRVRKLIAQWGHHAGQCRPLRDHEDLRDDRSAKGHRREEWRALRRDAHRFQVHRRKARKIRGRACAADVAPEYRELSRKWKPARRGWRIQAITSAAAKRATATARRISCATRMATAPRWSSPKSRLMRQSRGPHARRIARRGLCGTTAFILKRTAR